MKQTELPIEIVSTPVRLRGITLTQPWASLLVWGEKRWETRSQNFPRKLRGRVVIHSSKRFPYPARQLCQVSVFKRALARHGIRSANELPLGQILGVAHVRNCFTTESVVKTLTRQERAFGNYTNGRLALEMIDVRRLNQPIACRGALSFWRVPEPIEREVLAQLEPDECTNCPQCGRQQRAIAEPIGPGSTMVYRCECGYTIIESERTAVP